MFLICSPWVIVPVQSVICHILPEKTLLQSCSMNVLVRGSHSVLRMVWHFVVGDVKLNHSPEAKQAYFSLSLSHAHIHIQRPQHRYWHVKEHKACPIKSSTDIHDPISKSCLVGVCCGRDELDQSLFKNSFACEWESEMLLRCSDRPIWPYQGVVPYPRFPSGNHSKEIKLCHKKCVSGRLKNLFKRSHTFEKVSTDTTCSSKISK